MANQYSKGQSAFFESQCRQGSRLRDGREMVNSLRLSAVCKQASGEQDRGEA